jgi:hypothetical protein
MPPISQMDFSNPQLGHCTIHNREWASMSAINPGVTFPNNLCQKLIENLRFFRARRESKQIAECGLNSRLFCNPQFAIP